MALLAYRLSRHRFVRLPLDLAIVLATGALWLYRQARAALRLERQGRRRPLAHLSFDDLQTRERVVAGLQPGPTGVAPEVDPS